MGTFKVAIEVGDLQGQHYERIEALVDTGASYLALPRSLLTRLGVVEVERRPFSLADGRTVEYPLGVVSLRMDGRAFPVLCVFNEEGTEPALGTVPLETFGLAVDPVGRRLVPVPGLLMGLGTAFMDASAGKGS